MASHWQLSDIPDMTGKTAVITGGNTGLGFKTGLELARRGAEVVIGSRSGENGALAVERLCAELPDAKVRFATLELTSPKSISAFSAGILGSFGGVDILYHNAGLVMHRDHVLTETGRELQMQINHLGHFALTCLLMPALLASENARIVQATTVPYHKGEIDFDDFDWRHRAYDNMQSYFDSRLAQLLFAFTLNQKFRQAGLTARAISMQPGLVNTEGLQKADFGGCIMKALAQPLEKGCRTHLRCCTDLSLDGDRFWEPRFAIFGRAVPKPIKAPARDPKTASKLLQLSEELTGTELLI
ncbi:MAG: SDR family NAD(P)-dependent oxidoreductase [Parvibaculales bacterium]